MFYAAVFQYGIHGKTMLYDVLCCIVSALYQSREDPQLFLYSNITIWCRIWQTRGSLVDTQWIKLLSKPKHKFDIIPCFSQRYQTYNFFKIQFPVLSIHSGFDVENSYSEEKTLLIWSLVSVLSCVVVYLSDYLHNDREFISQELQKQFTNILEEVFELLMTLAFHLRPKKRNMM